MDRFILTDAQWETIEPHCLGKQSDPGRTGGDGRLFLEAVLWIARTGSPWRDLPVEFGPWNTVFKRFWHWVKANVFKRIFDALSDDPDMEYAMVDATIVKVQTGTGRAQKGDSKPGHRQVKGWDDDENPGSHRCVGQSGAFQTASGPSFRHRGC